MFKLAPLFFALLLTSCATAPKLTPEQLKVSYVDEVKGAKSELYTRASVWFAKTFNDSKSVLEVQDKEAGRLVGKGISKCDPLNTTGAIRYTLDVAVKDGKSRLVFENLTLMEHDYKTGILVEVNPLDLIAKKISTVEDVAKIKSVCLDSLHQSFLEALDGKKVAPAEDF